MGRAKNYNKYEFTKGFGKYHLKKRLVKIKNKNISSLIRNNRHKSFNFHNDLELPLSKTCKLVGVYNRHVPRKFAHKNYDPDSTMKTCLMKASDPFLNFCEENNVNVFSGDWKYAIQNLVDMATPSKVKGYSLDDMLLGLRSRKDLELKLPKLGNWSPEEIKSVRVNKTSYPGLNTSKAFGQKREISTYFTKGLAYHYCKDFVMADRKNYLLDTSLYHVGGREKKVVSNYNSKYSLAKTRITLCQEDIPTLIGQSVVVRINESLQLLSEGFNWGGRINGRGNFLDLLDKLSPDDGETNFNTDFSGHDNSVQEHELVFAMGILYCCFEEDPKLIRVFMYILSSLVFKRVVSPESRIIYELSKGLPTGHSFTSILTTITAYVKISTAIFKVCDGDQYVINKTYLQGAGDDWIGKGPKQLLSKFSKHINLYSGATCDDFSLNAHNMIRCSDDGNPTFLKKNYKNGGIAWNQLELFINMSWPTSKRSKKVSRWIHDKIVMCTSGPFDFELNLIIKNCIAVYLMERLYEYKFRGKSFNEVCSLSKSNNDLINKVINLAGFNFRTLIDINSPIFDDYKVINQHGVYMGVVKPRNNIKYYWSLMDKKIRRSMTYMLATRMYHKFESLVRLKVFDVKKTFVIYQSFDYSVSLYHKYYLSYSSYLL